MNPRKRKSKVDRRSVPLFTFLPALWDDEKKTFVTNGRSVIVSEWAICLPLAPVWMYDGQLLLDALTEMTGMEVAR